MCQNSQKNHLNKRKLRPYDIVSFTTNIYEICHGISPRGFGRLFDYVREIYFFFLFVFVFFFPFQFFFVAKLNSKPVVKTKGALSREIPANLSQSPNTFAKSMWKKVPSGLTYFQCRCQNCQKKRRMRTMMLSLWRSPIPKTYVATQQPATEYVKFLIAMSSCSVRKNRMMRVKSRNEILNLPLVYLDLDFAFSTICTNIFYQKLLWRHLVPFEFQLWSELQLRPVKNVTQFVNVKLQLHQKSTQANLNQTRVTSSCNNIIWSHIQIKSFSFPQFIH